MKSKTSASLATVILILIALFGLEQSALGQTPQHWQIAISQSLQQEESVNLALDDLITTGAEIGILFKIINDSEDISGSAIIVGDATRNKRTKKLIDEKTVHLSRIEDNQGYEIVTRPVKSGNIMVVAGGSVIGDVYGLYWIWDRIRVYKSLPDINVKRTPALKTRLSLAWGRGAFGGGSKEAMRHALRLSVNWVSGTPVLDLVPWNSDPEKSVNEENREKTRQLIEYAHSLHMKYFSFANEFTYHPTILKEMNAELTPCDSNFWKALQEKYRRLFKALPELDGIELCTDDISGFWDDYRGFDLMHQGKGCEWPLDKRYRTFVKKIWDVVVGEFDKTYFHFTWGLVLHEQHYSAEVFREIFTDDVPVKNLFLIPKITAGDRWWHQSYNPTFNQSQHNTLVAFETMNYYEGGRSNIFPTFSGQYFQAGLQTFLNPKENNVQGAGYLVASPRKGWDTYGAYSYVLYRLSWDPNESIEQIAEDFCAIYFGEKAAKEMAEIYLMTSVAYKYGLHIEPVSYGKFNSFIHMRVNVFPVMGYPRIDGGREHMEFLQAIYLRCKPWEYETLDDLDHGLETAKLMVEKYKKTLSKIADPDLAQELENRLNMTRWLIETNNQYVRTFFAYFAYRENPMDDTKRNLAAAYSQLLEVRDNFMRSPGFGYNLFGIDQLLESVKQALVDLNKEEQSLKLAPTRRELESTITHQQKLYKEILKKHQKEAVKFLHVKIKIDGRDILLVKNDNYKVEHLRWDNAHIQKVKFFEKLPAKAVTVIPLDIQSRPIHPFILEQPATDNDFTVKVYLYDKPGGDGIMEFDLYYIPQSPEEVGLNIPWKR